MDNRGWNVQRFVYTMKKGRCAAPLLIKQKIILRPKADASRCFASPNRFLFDCIWKSRCVDFPFAPWKASFAQFSEQLLGKQRNSRAIYRCFAAFYYTLENERLEPKNGGCADDLPFQFGVISRWTMLICEDCIRLMNLKSLKDWMWQKSTSGLPSYTSCPSSLRPTLIKVPWWLVR